MFNYWLLFGNKLKRLQLINIGGPITDKIGGTGYILHIVYSSICNLKIENLLNGQGQTRFCSNL
jgi:hypothetical protein